MDLNVSEAEIDGAVASAIERQREAPFVSVEVERTGETTAPFNIFFPGILTMMVMFAVTLNAISIVEERLDGRLERLMITGSGLNGIFAGKFLAGMVRGFLQAFILATLGWAAFRSFGPSDYGGMLVVDGSVLAAFARCHCGHGHRFIRPNARTGELVGSDHHDGNGDDRGVVFRTCQGWDSRRHQPGLTYQVRKRRAENRPFGYGGQLGDVWLEIAVLGGLAIVLLVVSRQLFSALQGRDG